MPIRIVNGLNCTQHGKADQRLQHQERHCLFDGHLTRRDRPRARALDLGVEIAVGDVVPGAAGAAHREGADEEQQAMPRIGIGFAGGDRSEPGRPPAGQQQQPGADRAVEPRQAQIGLEARTVRPYRPSCRSNRRRGPALSLIGSARLPVSVSKVLPLFFADGVFGRRDRNARGAERIAEARRARCRRRGGVADLGADLERLGVIAPSSPSAHRAECGIRCRDLRHI